MKKVYFTAPLAALALFMVIYFQHRSGQIARDKAKEEQVVAAREAKLKAEQDARKAAMADAVRAQELRKKERDAKAAREIVEKEARQVAVDARDKAYREQEKLSRQIERIKLDLAKEKAELAKLAESQKVSEAEKAFLQSFVLKAQSNVQSLQALLTKLNTPPPAPAVAASK
jgi:uncharacterized protein YpuA (DUF1002 family)